MQSSSDARETATRLLETLETAGTPGDSPGLETLVPLVYDQLCEMAHRQLGQEADAGTMQTTALVHEAYLKLVDSTRVTREGRDYFFGAAARAMRQVLVDRARRRNAGKRGGGVIHVELDDERAATDRFATDLLDLDRALDRLSELNPRHARVIECRYFAGLSVEETAAALGVSPRTVKYDWALSRAWLRTQLG